MNELNGQQPQNTLTHGWRYAPLGELCEFVRGVNFDQSEVRNTSIPEYYPILRAGNIGDKLNTSSDLVWVPASKVSEVQRLRIKDIAVCMSSGSASVVGKTARLETPFTGSVGAFCGIIRARNPELADYIALWLRSPDFIAWRDGQARGANIQNLRFSQFENIPVPLPPLPEQTRIAAILTEQMAAVEKARAATEAQLQAAKALPDAYINAIFNGVNAQHWEKKPLGAICSISAKQVDPTLMPFRDLPHINGENIEGGSGRLLTVKSAAEDRMTSGKYLFAPGDVLYSKIRPYLRKAVLVDFEGVCSADVYPITADKAQVNSQYLLWLLISQLFTNYANEESRRARMPKLNRNQLFSWLAPLPSLVEQEKIAQTLTQRISAVDMTAQALRMQLSLINKMPSALLNQAFSGKLTQRKPVQVAIPEYLSHQNVAFARNMAAALVINQFYQQATFGRIQLAKFLYLVETFVGIHLAGHYKRKKWGPLDEAMLDNIETVANSGNWFYRQRRDYGGYEYHIGPNIGDLLELKDMVQGENLQKLDKLFGLLANQKTKEVEAVTTLFAVWNDFLLDGHEPTDEEIIHEMRGNWHPAKARFQPMMLRYRLHWMRSNGLVPTGTGTRTEQVNDA